MTGPMLTEIDHVAIAVRDLEAAIDYYRTTFGGYSYYHAEPPGYSKFSDTSRGGWFSGSKSSTGGYHGAPSAAA